MIRKVENNRMVKVISMKSQHKENSGLEFSTGEN